MGLRARMSRLERQADGLYRTLRLPDGAEVRYTPEEMLEAVAACVRSEASEHRLLPHILRMDGYQGMVGLVKRLQESRGKSGDGS
jgi:hypothetical protein